MNYVHTEQQRLASTRFKGGRLATARAEATAAEAAVQPRLDEVRALIASRAIIRARQAELIEPRSLDDIRESMEMEIQLRIVDAQIKMCNTGMETGEGRALFIARDQAARVLNAEESELGLVRAGIAEHCTVLGSLLVRLNALTDNPDDLALTITAKA